MLIGVDFQSKKRLLVIVDGESVLLTSVKICTKRKLTCERGCGGDIEGEASEVMEKGGMVR